MTKYDDDLFNKSVCCPVCNSKFTELSVKVNKPRILSKDSDFFLRYKGVNPYFYDVWICNTCGYSSLKHDFSNLREKQKSLVLEHITPKWTPKSYPSTFDIDTALSRYKLSLIVSHTCQKKVSILGITSIKIAWMYRLKNDSKNELFFLEKALNCFLEAFLNEAFPIFGLYRDGLTFLIGELYNRTNQKENAMLWYSKVILNTNSSPKIKEMARNARYSLKEE